MKQPALLLACTISVGTLAQIPGHVPTNGLVGWWPFNGNALDESGNGHHLTVNGASLASDRFGDPSTAFHFNGSGAHMNGGSHPDFEIPYSRTLSVWVRNGTSFNTDQGIVAYVPDSGPLAGHPGYFLRRRYPGEGYERFAAYEDSVYCCWGGPYVAVLSDQPYGPGTWHHVLLWRDSILTRLYVDGMLQSDSIRLTPRFEGSVFLVGYNGSQGQYYHGEIDDIALWNRALTTEEILALYNAPPSPKMVSIAVLLEGALRAGSLLMGDELRAAGSLPLEEPYTALGYFHIGGGGDEETIPSVLSTTGPNAIVDWVVVELRDPDYNGFRVASRSALLQRDGDIVDIDGVSPVSFETTPGSYFLSVKHRNHLGVMTSAPISIGPGVLSIDFTAASTAVFGSDARKAVDGRFVLWTGDATFNGQMKYTGAANDRDPILVRVGSISPNNTTSGYFREDTNMDGIVKYTGTGNDRDPILVNIGSTAPNNVRNGQVP